MTIKNGTAMKAIQLSLFKPSNQLDFYCKDGYLTAYGEDAKLAAKVCGDRLEYRNGQPVLSLNLIRRCDIVFPRLIRAGFFIRIVEL